MTQVQTIRYKPTPTGQKFHESDAFVKMIMGPFGSGKSVCCAKDMQIYAMAQAPSPETNVRYTRWGVIRGTYPQLESTTRPTLLRVLPKECGTIGLGAPMNGLYRWPLPDGTEVQMEIVCIALQTPDDVEKIKSADWTGAWISEPTNIHPDIFGAVMGRIGRFPSMDMGGCSWAGILMDFNKPPNGHWLTRMVEDPLDNWAYFEQPPAVIRREEVGKFVYDPNPDAENLENLIEGYYDNQVNMWLQEGRSDIVDSLFALMSVDSKDGKPVWPSFNREEHVARSEIHPIPYVPVVVGMDTSGIHPSAVICQQQAGQWCILDELVGDGVGFGTFIEQFLHPLIKARYANSEVVVSCDPANARDAYTGLAPTVHLEQLGYQTSLPTTNHPPTRIRSVETMLNKRVGGLLISPNCKQLIQAMAGGYHYKRLRVTGTIDVAYDNKPDKRSIHSHVADALQYMAMYVNQDTLVEKMPTHLTNRMAQRRRTLGRIM